MNRGQPNQKRLSRERHEEASHLIGNKFSTKLQTMFLRRIVVEARFQIQAIHLWQQQITFRRMEIPR